MRGSDPVRQSTPVGQRGSLTRRVSEACRAPSARYRLDHVNQGLRIISIPSSLFLRVFFVVFVWVPSESHTLFRCCIRVRRLGPPPHSPAVTLRVTLDGAHGLIAYIGWRLTPTSYYYNHENILSLDPEIIGFWVLDGPGGTRNLPKR